MGTLLAMAVAGLPMYDLPEVRPALDALWAGVARHLRREEVADAPERLTYELSGGALWREPALLFSQCCGADLVGACADALRPLATPCYRAEGCAGGRYASVLVVGEDEDIAGLEDLRGRVAAINHPESHSGSNALRALIAPRSRGGRFFARVVVSGSHAASLALVASRQAAVAAIDCVTHALLARHRPAALAGTRPLCRTAPAPAPPFVTRRDAGDELVRRLRSALHGAFADPALGAARADLLLDGIEVLPPAAYARITAFARFAARHGYPVLG
jgi:ABC-type phosphate/phosphonate transport system substrate-binding protein